MASHSAKIQDYRVAYEISYVMQVRSAKEESNNNLHKLHKQIYQGRLHPQNVFYCLISRVQLGKRIAFTQDGKTHMGSNSCRVFSDKDRRTLAPFQGEKPTSLIGEPGGRVDTFREYVVFEPERIFVEYLVAYKRVRSLCNCGVKVAERTVSKPGVNRGRKIHLCGKIGTEGEKKCDFIRMFPLCECGESAHVAVSHSAKNPNRRYYCCHQKRLRGRSYSSCDFFAWADNNNNTTTNPAKRARMS